LQTVSVEIRERSGRELRMTFGRKTIFNAAISFSPILYYWANWLFYCFTSHVQLYRMYWSHYEA